MSHAPAAGLKRLNSDILNDPLNWVNGVSSDWGLVIVVIVVIRPPDDSTTMEAPPQWPD